MKTRPKFNGNGLSAAVRHLAERKAAASWCYVSPEGGSFYLAESTVRAMQARYGGDIFPPEEP